MKERIEQILSSEYHFSIDRLDSLEGGYRPDETYLVVTCNQLKLIVKYIKYSSTLEHLRSILQFQNVLHHSYEYPCSQIILSNKQELVLSDNDRFLFVQTFIQGIEPTRELIDKDDVYFNQMGRFLAQWRIVSRQYSLGDIRLEAEQHLMDQCWKEQQIDNGNPFLISNLMECRQYLSNLNGSLERGLIHNDFHTNNSLLTDDGKIYIIDFIDACHSVFVADLATSLFHLLSDEQNGKQRAKVFLQGYQQIIRLTEEETKILDIFVRLKLTLSIIEDLRNSDDLNHPFIQSCFRLLHTLNNHPTLVKGLLTQ